MRKILIVAFLLIVTSNAFSDPSYETMKITRIWVSETHVQVYGKESSSQKVYAFEIGEYKNYMLSAIELAYSLGEKVQLEYDGQVQINGSYKRKLTRVHLSNDGSL